MTLTKVDYLRLSTFLPILVPIVLGAVAIASLSLDVRAPEWLSAVGAVTMSAGLLFGIPYLMLMAVVLFLLRNNSWRAHAAAAIVMPWLMIAVLLPLVAMWGDRSTIKDIAAAARVFAPYCLSVGYGYVALALAGMAVLSFTGHVRG